MNIFYQMVAQIVVGLLLIFRGTKPSKKLKAEADFDLERFCGTWYTAAYSPLPFAKKLNYLSTEYSSGENGTIKIIERGYDRKKKNWHQQDFDASFKESADLGWFLINTGHRYQENRKIVYLSEDYQRAIFVGLTMRTFSLAYRDPDVSKREIDALIVRAEELGFKTKRMKRVDQSKRWQDDSGQ